MRYMLIEAVTSGMIIGKDIYDANDSILLCQGKRLSELNVTRLRELGYARIYIQDNLTRDIRIDDILSPEIRSEACQSIRNFDLDEAKKVAEAIVERILSAESVSIDMVDLKTFDSYTYQHSVNVAVLATIVGMGMGFSADKLKELCIAGMFHDMGKLEVPAEILNKPSKLTTEEYDIIKKHPQKSYDLLADRFELSSNVRMGVLCHHENEDGSGYPRGLTGDKINIFAKILHVVDVYDALTSKRSYKKAYACSEALEYLMGGTATLFDEKVVDVFMKYVPIYPKGMQVLLSDGRKGVIVRNNHISSLRPVVRMVDGLDIDLTDMHRYSTLTIVCQANEDTATPEEIAQAEQERWQIQGH